MKIWKTLGLAAIGIALVTTTNWAQTTPTGTSTSITYPQGAVAPDSMPAKLSRAQRRVMRQNRKMTNQNSKANAGSTTNTSTQDARYRQSSSSNGTAINNSNSTNYNSNNATNAPTGAGSNPNTATTPAPAATPATPPNPGEQVSNGQNNSAARSSSGSSGSGYAPNTGATNANAGSGAAVSGAKMTETPAVTAGSTVRNTSVGDFIASSPNYTTLQNALQAADLHETLKGTGPYTLFAPTNSAFKKLPAATQAGLLEGRNRESLKQLLSYHVVSGSLSADQLTKQIKDGNGKTQVKTLSGSMLTLQLDPNGRIQLTDEQGGTVSVEATDNRQMNGMVYGLDTVLMPKMGVNSFR
ncbi:fasciclin domain-containing protein [Spirosoma areae]